MIVAALPVDVVFDVAIRLVGLPIDFEHGCGLEVALSAPTFEDLGKLLVMIQPRGPGATYLPGSEINHHVITRIDFEAIEYGPHHLEFELDGKAQPHVNTAVTVIDPAA